jgi:F-type H+-transporting ATPase subunit b
MATEVHQAAAGAASGASGGLPQFDPTWWAGEIFWFAAIFLLVFILMAKVFMPRIGGTIEEREKRITGDIRQAMDLKEQAEAQAAQADAEMAEARSRSHKLAADAKARAQAEANERQAVEEAKLGESVAKAEAEIRAARDEALSHVREIASETAQSILVRLTGEPASAAELKAVLAARG